MRTKTFFNGAAILALGASSLLATPVPDNSIEQHAKAKLGIYKAEPTNSQQEQQAAPTWMERNLHAKTGTYSPAEEARLREVQNSEAFRQEISNAHVPSWVERNRQVKQGQ